MNHVYKTIFNRGLGLWQVVSELAKSRGKTGSSTNLIQKITHYNHYISSSRRYGAAALIGLFAALPVAAPVWGQAVNTTGDVTVMGVPTGPTPPGGDVSDELPLTPGNSVLPGLQPNPWNIGGNLTIGYANPGALSITDGGTVSSGYTHIGSLVGSSGAVTVDGAGSKLTGGSSINVGQGGTGTLDILGGGSVRSVSAGIGSKAGAQGTATVAGPGSTWTLVGSQSPLEQDVFAVGSYGAGTLNITNGGSIVFYNNEIGLIGRYAGATGTVTVDGAGSKWQLYNPDYPVSNDSQNLSVGYNGTGTLNITNGGVVSDRNGYIGDKAGGTGTVTVDGSGSQWNNSMVLAVGYNGTGTLNITNGGSVAVPSFFFATIGWQAGSQGTVTVDGSGSNLTVGAGGISGNSAGFSVGDHGTGTLNITRGGLVSTEGGDIGYNTGSQGVVTIDGAGSAWVVRDNLYVGSSTSSGILTITNGGLAKAASVVVGATGATISGIGGALNIGAAAGDAAAAPGTLDTPTIKVDTMGKLVFNHTDGSYQFAPVISGNGTLWQLAGTTLLTGANNFAGATTVEGGELRITGASTLIGTTSVNGGDLRVTGTLNNVDSLNQSHNVAVNSGGVLSGTGAITGGVAVNHGGTLKGVAGETLTMGALTFASTSRLDVTLGLPSTSALFKVNGNLTLGGLLDVHDAGAFGDGLYRLIDYSGSLTDKGLNIGVTPVGYLPGDLTVQTAEANHINLLVSASGLPSYAFWDGANTSANGAVNGGSGAWSAAGTNWTTIDGSANGAYDPAAMLVFQGTGGVVTVDAGGAGLSLPLGQSVQFFTDGYLVKGNGLALTKPVTTFRVGDGTKEGAAITATIESVLSGAGVVEKTDLGTLALTGANLYTGGTIINSGTLVGSVASFGTGDIVNNARLVIDQAADASFAKTITGSGTLVKQNSNNLTLTGANTYSGGTTISAGTLTGSVTNFGTGAIQNDATLVINQGSNAGFANDISGSGTLIKQGAGNLTLSGANTYSGGTTISAGTLTVSSAANFGTGAIQDDAALVVKQDHPITIVNNITGSGTFTKQGVGNLTLSGLNTYGGGTTISEGTLTGSVTSLGAGDILLSYTSTALVIDQATDAGFANIIKGTGTLTKQGAGTLTLGGVQTYTGTTTVNAGELRVTDSLASGAVTVKNGGALSGATATIAGSVTVNGGGTLKGASGDTLTMGALTLSSGSIVNAALGAPSPTGLFQVNGNLTLDGTLNVSDKGGFGDGLYRLIDYTGLLTNNSLDIGAAPAGYDGKLTVLVSQAHRVSLLVGAANTGSYNFWNGGGGNWSASDPNWSNFDNSASGIYDPAAQLFFTGAGGTVQVNGDGDALVVGPGIQFASGGYTVQGDDLMLISPTTTLNVGDGTPSGAGMTATIAANLGGMGGVLKTGLGTLALTGVNTWTGDTTVDAGTLKIAGGGSVADHDGLIGYTAGSTGVVTVEGTGSKWVHSYDLYVGYHGNGTLNISGGGSVANASYSGYLGFNDDATGTVTVAGPGSAWSNRELYVGYFGNGTLNITGGGLVSASASVQIGTNSGTGVIHLDGGTLDSPTVNIGANGTLSGAGTVTHTVTVASGGTLAGASGGTLTMDKLTLASGSNIDAALGAATPPAPVLFKVTGALTLNGGTVNVSDAGGFGQGLYRLIDYGTLAGSFGNLTIGATPTGYAAGDMQLQNDAANTDINLFVGAPTARVFWDGANTVANNAIDGGSGTWSAAGTNWTTIDGSANGIYDPAAMLIFSGTTGGTVTVASGGVSIGQGIQFFKTGYTVQGGDLALTAPTTTFRVGDGSTPGIAATIASAITGSGDVQKTDLGTLTLTGANSWGSTTVNGGTLTLTGTNDYSGNTTVDGGTLKIAGGGSVSNSYGYIGNAAGATGTVTVDGTNSAWNNGRDLMVGRYGTGTLTITNGGSVTSDYSYIGDYAGATGTVTVDGKDSTWTNGMYGGYLAVGREGTGTLTITNGGSVASYSGYIGDSSGSTGTVTVGGTNSKWTTGSLYVGYYGTGTLNIENGGLVSAEDVQVSAKSNTGAISLNAGTLDAPTVSIGNHGTLSGAGTVTGAVTVASGGTLAGASGGTLTMGALTLSSGAIVNVALGASSTTEVFKVNGNLTLDGTLNVSNAGGFGDGDGLYRLISYTGTLIDNGLDIGTVPAGYTASNLTVQTSLANQVNLIVGSSSPSGAGPYSIWNNGPGVWNAANTNWSNADLSATGVYDTTNILIFQGAGGGIVTVNNGGTALPISAGGLQFANDGFTITGGGLQLASGMNTIRVGDGTAAGAAMTATIASAITGAGGIEKTDLGTLVLGGANNYTGATTVSVGTLAGNIAAGTDLSVAGGATYDGSGAPRSVKALTGAGRVIDGNGLTVQSGAFSGVISGAGGLTKIGAGTLTLSGANSYSGATAVNAGTLAIAAGGIKSNVTVTNTAATFNNAGTVTGSLTQTAGATSNTGAISGAVTVTGGTLAGSGSTGDLTIGNAAFNPANGAKVNGDFTANAGATTTVDGGTQLSVTGAFTQNAGATLNVAIGSNEPAITASTAVLGGALNVSGDSDQPYTVIHTSGGIGGDFANVTIGGAAGTVDYMKASGAVDGNDYKIDFGLTWNAAPAQAHGTFTLTDASDAFTVNTVLGDRVGPFASGWDGKSLTKNGAGTLILTGANTYDGGTNLNAGRIDVGNNSALGTGALTMAGGTTLGFAAAGLTIANGITVNGAGAIDTAGNNATLSGVISGTGALTKNGAGILSLTKDSSSYAGSFTLAAGGLDLASTAKLGGSFTQNAGTTLTSANGATLNNATFRGTMTPTGTLNLTTGTFNGATVNLGLLTAGNKITATGAINFAAPTTINVNASGVISDTDFILMSGANLTNANNAQVSATNLGSGYRAGQYSTATTLNYGVLTGPATLTWNGSGAAGSATSTWNTSNTNTNWNAPFATYFKNGDSVLFDSTAVSKNVTVDPAGVSIGAMTVSAPGYIFNLAAGSTSAITAAGAIDLDNATLNITGYSPDTTITSYPPGGNVETVITASGGITNFNPLVTVTGQSTVDFLSASAYQSDNNNIKVETRLTWYSTDPTRKANGNFTIADGQTFTLNAVLANNTTNLDGWNGTTLTKLGAGTLVLNGDNSYTGGTALNAGRIDVGDNSALGGGPLTMAGGTTLGFAAADLTVANDITLKGAGTFATSGNDATIDGVISGDGGSGSLVKDGDGKLTLSGTNTYTGPTEVKAGILNLTGSLASATMILNDNTTFVNGGTVQLSTLDVHGSATWQGDLTMGAGQSMNFYIPDAMGGGSTMLTVTGGSAYIGGSALSWGFDGASSALKTGDQVTLIDVATNGKTLQGTPASVTGRQGATLNYTFDIVTEDNQLVATVASRSVDGAKPLSEGFVAGPALINQTVDFVADKGMAQAVEAAGGGKPGAGKAPSTTATGYNLGTFGAVSGGKNRYNTGSHVDVSSLSLTAGLAWGNSLDAGHLTLGAFFEYGNGSYDTYNSFTNNSEVHGDGDMYHLGGGVLGRMDFTDAGPGMFYAEAGARAGSVNNDYKNGNLGGFAVNYESDAAYYGIHAGAGYILNLGEKTSLDLYGKYFWTRQNGDAVRLATGDPVRFDNVDSHRLRVGGRLFYAVNDLVSPYAGLAYEHEFDGEAKATAYGQAIQAPSLKGGTGIGEIGLAIKASKNLPLSVDLGVRGYVGTREGVTGSLQVRYEF